MIPIRTRACILLIVVVGMTTCVFSAFSNDSSYPYDTKLCRVGARQGTLGPTGSCLSADRLDEAPGFGGVFNYGQRTQEFTDPLVLTFSLPSGFELDLAEERTLWFPSHMEIVWSNEWIRVTEQKFITHDNLLVDRLHIVNLADHALDLDVHLSGKQTWQPARFLSQQIPVDLSRIVNSAPQTGRELAIMSAGEPFIQALPFCSTLGEDSGLTLPARSVEIDAVRYLIPPFRSEGRAVWVLLRSGEQGGAAQSLPEQAAFNIPDAKPAIAHLHLLVAAIRTGEAPDQRAPARFRVYLDNGVEEQIPWHSPNRGLNAHTGDVQAGDGRRPHRGMWIRQGERRFQPRDHAKAKTFLSSRIPQQDRRGGLFPGVRAGIRIQAVIT
ncbi:MAG: hypothetical protein ABIK28_25535 [Planctomycetota bacterium]